MTLIDTHSHVYLPEFDQDRNDMLERAKAEGVSGILLPAIDSTTHSKILSLEEEYPDSVFSMVGLHPCSVKRNYRDELAIALKYLEKRPFKAIGETGLDFYWDKTFTKEQYVSFHEQIEWALNFDVPVVIHSRNSIDECIRVIAEHQKGKLKGVFHCFSGNIEQAERIIDMGFYLGIGGVVTFKNSGLDKVVAYFNLNSVILETDAPYLAPVPFRGKRNEPAYLKYVIEKLSGVKEMSGEEIARITTENAKKLFRL